LTLALEGCEWSASRTRRSASREKAPSTHWIGGWVDPSAGLALWITEQSLVPVQNQTPARSYLVAIPTELSCWARVNSISIRTDREPRGSYRHKQHERGCFRFIFVKSKQSSRMHPSNQTEHVFSKCLLSNWLMAGHSTVMNCYLQHSDISGIQIGRPDARNKTQTRWLLLSNTGQRASLLISCL
jgi:hypothetical protein